MSAEEEEELLEMEKIEAGLSEEHRDCLEHQAEETSFYIWAFIEILVCRNYWKKGLQTAQKGK